MADVTVLQAVRRDTSTRAHRLVTETFEAFQLGDTGRPYYLGRFETLEACIERASVHHKQKFFVRRTNELTGDVMLHFYVVKRQSRAVYVYENYETKRVQPLYAEHLHDLRISDLPDPQARLTGSAA